MIILDTLNIVLIVILAFMINLVICNSIFDGFIDKDSVSKTFKIVLLIPPFSILIGIGLLLIFVYMFIKETISNLF